ncbi:hypothetical protein QD357_29165 [Rhizobium sp. BR 317]|uniref:Uncharacterized protein n=1 Tax=Rhizobium paranaense TaxID=1650438 RepID=A0A7W8XTM8_9HYPH|nr:hypothetical protein [Rhizobium paranaense]MBB5575399.1 hypothetical protein [Rhizobium paranaense]
MNGDSRKISSRCLCICMDAGEGECVGVGGIIGESAPWQKNSLAAREAHQEESPAFDNSLDCRPFDSRSHIRCSEGNLRFIQLNLMPLPGCRHFPEQEISEQTSYPMPEQRDKHHHHADAVDPDWHLAGRKRLNDLKQRRKIPILRIHSGPSADEKCHENKSNGAKQPTRQWATA